MISDCIVSQSYSCWRVRKSFYWTPRQQALTPFIVPYSSFSLFMVGHKSSSASPSSWILASNVLISSRRKNNHFWESNCCICVLIAMLRHLLCKSCTCWIASYWPNIPGRLKLGLGCMLVKGPEREESCPLFSHRAPRCLQPVPTCGQGRPLGIVH